MLAKCSKMSKRSQCQARMKESKGPEMNGERTVEGSCGINNQPRTRTCVRLKKSRREQMQGICMPERHHKPKLVFGRRESRVQTISTSVCQRGSRNLSSCLAYMPEHVEHEHRSLLLIKSTNNTRLAKLTAKLKAPG